VKEQPIADDRPVKSIPSIFRSGRRLGTSVFNLLQNHFLDNVAIKKIHLFELSE